MSDLSARLALPYLMPAQAQKHVTLNEALTGLDALVQASFEALAATTPPPVPAPGEMHALAATATGAWAGQEAGTLAYWDGSAWIFLAPQPGWRGWDKADGRLVAWDGSAWVAVGGNPDMLGVNATPDAVNRLAVGSQASLFSHDGAGHQVKVNKAAAGDDAGFVFQTNWSTRALFGTLGDDDFTLKVSDDGSSFTNALEVAADDGVVHLPQGLRLGGGTDVFSAYEDDSWTPGLGAATTEPTGLSFSATGKYARLGKLVLASFEISVTAAGSGGTGLVQIRDLPFASWGNFYSSDLRHAGVSFPGTGVPVMRSSGTTLSLFSTNGSDLLWQNLSGSNFSLLGSFLYMTNG